MICPDCENELIEGDGVETPSFYCRLCGIGWDNPESIIREAFLPFSEYEARIGRHPTRGRKAHLMRLWNRFCRVCAQAGVNASRYARQQAQP